MKILRPVDIEDQTRLALADYLTTYARPLPANFLTPCILVAQAGGQSSNSIDTFILQLSARAETDDEANEYLRTAIGLLEAQARAQFGALRYVQLNSLASWGNDPVRPDLKLATATVQVTAHRETFEINES